MESTRSNEMIGLATSLVTAYLMGDRAVIDDLLADTGDPELVAALAVLSASMVTAQAETQNRHPLLLWSESLMAHMPLG